MVTTGHILNPAAFKRRFEYIELLLPPDIRVNEKQAVKGERYSEK